jgi:hypothetical protein
MKISELLITSCLILTPLTVSAQSVQTPAGGGSLGTTTGTGNTVLATNPILSNPNIAQINLGGNGFLTETANGDFIFGNNGFSGMDGLMLGSNTTLAPCLKPLNSILEIVLGGSTTCSSTLSPIQASVVLTNGYTVSALPTCNAVTKGGHAYVTDAVTPTFMGTLTGSSTTIAPVFCNGSVWLAG